MAKGNALWVLILLLALPAPVFGQALGDRLTQETIRLLEAYGQHKNHVSPSAQAVEISLSNDRTRRAIFHAGVRAMFTEILDRDQRPTGELLIDFVDTFTGIWGVRTGSRIGEHQFRLSVKWRSKSGRTIHDALSESFNFPRAYFSRPHVLKPGGDDDPTFVDFRVDNDAITRIQVIWGHPKIQVSYLKDDPTVGEVDLDFHYWYAPCHYTPSNSDPASVGRNSHSHRNSFNARFEPILGSSFLPGCLDANNHCEVKYVQPHCGP